MKHTLLCVDDEADIVDSLERLFRKKYHVLKATSGKEALELLKENAVSIIISDQRMPNMTGVEFLSKSIKTHPEAVRILLTGYTDIDSVISAINSGQIYRYVTKPWDPRDLSNAVDRAVERYELSAELKEKNEALEKALEELKVLDQAKDQFMILINHELKTPLTTLSSFLELLQETKLDEEQKKYLSRIAGSSDRLKEIVNDVLELVSAETGRTFVQKSNFKFQKLFDEISKNLQSLLESKDQSLLLSGGEIKLSADYNILYNVLRRILHNASKFADPKSEIHLHCEETKDHWHIFVENKGKEISKQAIEKIKKPFTLDENIMNHSKGLGLGLSLSQALLRIHNSQLEIQSSSGKTQVGFILTPGL